METESLLLNASSTCRSFLTFAERLAWYLLRCAGEGGETGSEGCCRDEDDEDDTPLRRWLVDICKPSAFEIDTNVQDTSDHEDSHALIDIYQNLPLLRLVLSDEAFASIRFAKVRLSESLRRFERHHSASSGAAQHSFEWVALLEIMKYVREIPSDDRASSYVILSKMELHGTSEALLERFPVDATLYPCESFYDMLVAACAAGHASMVAELLENGAASQSDEQGKPLTSAVRHNHLDVVQQLDAAGQIPANGAAIVSGLRLACTRGSIAMVDTLLAHYSCSSNAWEHHPTLLRSAVQSDNLQVVKLLLECDPRGAFIRLDQLIEHLAREMKSSGSSQTPRLDAIVGKNGYAPWDLSAFEASVANNDSVLFDLLVNHIEWNHEELDAAMATARTSNNTHMAKIISLLQQSIPNDDGEPGSLQPSTLVYAPGDVVEARKRGRATFSSAVIDQCWLNGTYDVRFSEGTTTEGDDTSKMLSFTKVEKEVHPQMIRHRSAHNWRRIDTMLREINDNERVVADGEGAIAPTTAEHDIFETTESPFSENDEDDQEIRADAAIMGERELDLLPELRNVLGDSEEEVTAAHECPSTYSSSSSSDPVDNLLQPTVSGSHQQLQTANKESLSDLGSSFAECDAVKARSQGSSEFDPMKVKFCPSNDHLYGDGDQDTLVLPWGAVRDLLCEASSEESSESGTCETADNAESTLQDRSPGFGGRCLAATVTASDNGSGDEEQGEVGATSNTENEDSGSSRPLASQATQRESKAGTAASRTTKSSAATLVVPLIPATTAKGTTRMTALRSARPLATSSRRAPTPEKPVVSARRATNANKPPSSGISWREVEEWKNVDLILSRKRRFLNGLSGGIESSKVPWGEEFAAIQSLKRFAAQHPDVLREHM